MIIISDSSPLIGLSQIGHLDLINRVFDEIIIPPAVAIECTLHSHKPGAKLIQAAIDNAKIKIFKDKFDHLKNLSDMLGPGEIEAISLASQLSMPLLIDEKLGRDIAKKNNVNVIGTCGLLLAAKQQNAIKSIKPILEQLICTGYRISGKLIENTLNLEKKLK